MKTSLLIARLIFGGWFFVHGLNYFVLFFPQPPGRDPLAVELLAGLVDSGLLAVVKVAEVIVGIMLLANRFPALAAVMALPISVVIAYVNLALERDTLGNIAGSVTLGINAWLLVAYLGCYRPMLAAKPVPFAGVSELRPTRSH